MWTTLYILVTCRLCEPDLAGTTAELGNDAEFGIRATSDMQDMMWSEPDLAASRQPGCR